MIDELKAMVDLAVLEEREACARIADMEALGVCYDEGHGGASHAHACEEIARQIRARSNNVPA